MSRRSLGTGTVAESVVAWLTLPLLGGSSSLTTLAVYSVFEVFAVRGGLARDAARRGAAVPPDRAASLRESLSDHRATSMTRLAWRACLPAWSSPRSTSSSRSLITIATWRAPSTTYVGEGPDPVQAMWGIGWVPFAISHGLEPAVHHLLNTPTGTNMLWEHAFALPMAVVLWPVTVTLRRDGHVQPRDHAEPRARVRSSRTW